MLLRKPLGRGATFAVLAVFVAQKITHKRMCAFQTCVVRGSAVYVCVCVVVCVYLCVYTVAALCLRNTVCP